MESFHLSRNSGEIFEHIFSLSPSHCSTWPFINLCALIKQSLAKTNICTIFASFTILQDYFPCSMSNSKKGVYFYGKVGKERALPWSCRPQKTVISTALFADEEMFSAHIQYSTWGEKMRQKEGCSDILSA